MAPVNWMSRSLFAIRGAPSTPAGTGKRSGAMFPQTIEYALRAVVFLAGAPGGPHTTEQIAARIRVPRGYLSKVLQSLGRVGLLHARRGLHGGFTLARSPETITVLEVVNAVAPIQRIRTCPLGIESHGPELCPLHRTLDKALASVEREFERTTIADLLNTPAASEPLCHITIEGDVA